jgi:uncharacterized membrane protein YkvA (DUF1232 family)
VVVTERSQRPEPEPIEVGVRPTFEPPGEERHLLTFYDRLRQRIRSHVERRAPGVDERVVDALLVAPDFFVLLARLSLDRNVPVESRRLIAGAVAYFILPLDVLPEAILGPAGYVDDVVLAATVIGHVMGRGLEPFVDRYWSGDREVRAVLREVADSARALLGGGVLGRLRQLLAGRGVAL